jgi:hypothetical protein
VIPNQALWEKGDFARLAQAMRRRGEDLVRVTRPGGQIVMGNRIPGDPAPAAQVLRISSAYVPPPPAGIVRPMTWGVEANVLERFGAAGIPAERISCVRDAYTFEHSYPPRFRTYYGPTLRAFEAAGKAGRAEELEKELETLFQSQNRAGTTGTTSIPATFLRVTVAV